MEETHTLRTPSGTFTVHGGNESDLHRAVERIENGTLTSPDGGSLLHMAAYSGDIKDCEQFLEGPLKCDINGTDDRGETPLFRAIYQRNWEVMHFLIEKGADVTWSSKSGKTPLHHAANRGTREIVELLISKGADLHAKSIFGTPLYIAVAAGNHDTVEYLLELKADANPTESSLDTTPIFLATSGRSLKCLELLVKAGADPIRASYMLTPLCVAVFLDTERIIRYLLKADADPNMLNPVGLKAIEYAAQYGRRWAVEILFPVTSRIACYPDWSISGIMSYVRSQEGRARLLSKQKMAYKLAKAKGEEALKKNYHDACHWFNQAYINDDTDAEALSNMSLCHAMMFDGNEALKYAKACIALKPHWAKAHFREALVSSVCCNLTSILLMVYCNPTDDALECMLDPL